MVAKRRLPALLHQLVSSGLVGGVVFVYIVDVGVGVYNVLGAGEAAEFDSRNSHWFGSAGTGRGACGNSNKYSTKNSTKNRSSSLDQLG